MSCLITRLNNYVEATAEGVVDTELHHAEEDEDWVFSPDVSVMETSRVPPLDQNPVMVIPDLAIGVLSLDDRPGRVSRCVDFFLCDDVRLVWIIDTTDETVVVYRPGELVDLLSAPATLRRTPVLANFALDLADLFAVVHPDAYAAEPEEASNRELPPFNASVRITCRVARIRRSSLPFRRGWRGAVPPEGGPSSARHFVSTSGSCGVSCSADPKMRRASHWFRHSRSGLSGAGTVDAPAGATGQQARLMLATCVSSSLPIPVARKFDVIIPVAPAKMPVPNVTRSRTAP